MRDMDDGPEQQIIMIFWQTISLIFFLRPFRTVFHRKHVIQMGSQIDAFANTIRQSQ